MSGLEGITVLELATVLAGPAVGMFLAELGARVIKVESPKGDVTRSWKLGSEDTATTVSAYFSCVNWGKESVIADLTTEKGQHLIHSILAITDIVITNYLPEQATRLQMDAAHLLKQYPRLIYGAINGYGIESNRAGYDAVIQAEAGFMFLNTTQNGLAQKMPVALIDLIAAHQLKAGILLALYNRMKNGKGQIISVSLLDSGLTALANQASAYTWAGIAPQPTGSEHPAIAPYGSIFKTKDDQWILLAIGNDKQFQALVTILKLELDANLFENNQKRVQNRELLNQKLSLAIGIWQINDLLSQLHAQQIPAGSINNIPQALSAHTVENLTIFDERNKQWGIRTIAFNHNPLPLTSPPTLGEHQSKILKEFGIG